MGLTRKRYIVLAFLIFATFPSLRSQNSNSILQKTDSSTRGDDFCAKANYAKAVTNALIKTAVFISAVSALEQQVEQNPGKEYSLSFGRNQDSSLIVTPPTPGNASNGIIPDIADAFADLHNHPKNTPPSSGDVYGLLRKNKRSGSYTLRFIRTSNQTLYALCVVDTLQARDFLLRYPPQQTPGYSPLFPDKLLDEYRELNQRHKIPEEMVMAYFLERYKAGVVLLKQDKNGDFIALRMAITGSGDTLQAIQQTCN